MCLNMSGFSLMEQTGVNKENIGREKYDQNILYEIKFKLKK